jgi:hypothetical protein
MEGASPSTNEDIPHARPLWVSVCNEAVTDEKRELPRLAGTARRQRCSRAARTRSNAAISRVIVTPTGILDERPVAVRDLDASSEGLQPF